MVQQRECQAEDIVWIFMLIPEQKHEMRFQSQTSGAAWQRAGTVFLDGTKIYISVSPYEQISLELWRDSSCLCVSHIHPAS